jgi:ribonuclease HI
MSDNKFIEIYTDGACSPNPGKGGYGAIVVQGGQRRELSGGFRKTTNNRMEILAAIEGLKAVTTEQESGLGITIFSDSRYLVDMFNEGHARRWRSKGWMRGPRDRAKNEDLWGSLLDLASSHRVQFVWVKSHNEHPENERCDQLAVEARQQSVLPPDEGYEGLKTVGREQLPVGREQGAVSRGQLPVNSKSEEQLVML